MNRALLLGLILILAAAVGGTIAVVSSRPRTRRRRLQSRREPPRSRPHAKASATMAELVISQAQTEEPGSTMTAVLSRQVEELSPEEIGMTRRRFFNRAAGGLFATYGLVLGTSMLAFFWPRLSGSFGTRVDAGPIEDLKALLTTSDGKPSFAVVSEARAYIVPVSAPELATSQFTQPGLEVDGVMALWWRCVHLGCRTPWCASSIGFECPCHGSKYNLLGEYEAGPAPRNLDRFVIELTEDGRLIIDTGTIVQTPRAPNQTVDYPRGPSCI